MVFYSCMTQLFYFSRSQNLFQRSKVLFYTMTLFGDNSLWKYLYFFIFLHNICFHLKYQIICLFTYCLSLSPLKYKHPVSRGFDCFVHFWILRAWHTAHAQQIFVKRKEGRNYQALYFLDSMVLIYKYLKMSMNGLEREGGWLMWNIWGFRCPKDIFMEMSTGNLD